MTSAKYCFLLGCKNSGDATNQLAVLVSRTIRHRNGNNGFSETEIKLSFCCAECADKFLTESKTSIALLEKIKELHDNALRLKKSVPETATTSFYRSLTLPKPTEDNKVAVTYNIPTKGSTGDSCAQIKMIFASDAVRRTFHEACKTPNQVLAYLVATVTN